MQDIQVAIELGVDLMKDIVAAGYSFLKEKNKERDFFGAATKKYVGGLLERNSSIKVLTMREPQPLEKLYVRANILKDKITAELGLSAEELEKFHDLDRRAFGKIAETVDGELIVNQLKRFIVLGKPGAGKTTYLRYLTLMMLQPLSQIEQRKLPIFVTLREWADKKTPLLDFITEQFDICGFEEARPFVERVLANGDCIVLFDGLDEVSQEANQSGIIQQIKDFSDKYSENQFVISCRVAAYNRWFERFTDVEMADFNEEQIEKFIQNWFHAEPRIGQECWQKLQDSPQLKELASVPLLLTLLCIVYNRSNNFPPNRANLYEEAIDALLRDWDASHRITRDEVYRQLSINRKKSMFARIAWRTFTENMYFVPERILTKQIEKYIEHLPGFKPEELDVDSQAVLKSIEAQHGIFVERAKKVHSFAHLTFQEYFTAKYIVDNAKEGTLETLVNKHLYDDKWKEVFLLVAGILDSADEFLLLMQQKNHQLVEETPELDKLLGIARMATLPKGNKYFSMLHEVFEALKTATLPKENKYPLIFRETMAVFIALDRALDPDSVLDIARERAIERARERAFDLAREPAIDSGCVLYVASEHALKLAHDDAFDGRFTIDLLETEQRALELAHKPELGLDIARVKAFGGANKLTTENTEKIEQFLKGNVWIVKCLNSSTFVSAPVREKILNEMLKSRKEDE